MLSERLFNSCPAKGRRRRPSANQYRSPGLPSDPKANKATDANISSHVSRISARNFPSGSTFRRDPSTISKALEFPVIAEAAPSSRSFPAADRRTSVESPSPRPLHSCNNAGQHPSYSTPTAAEAHSQQARTSAPSSLHCSSRGGREGLNNNNTKNP